MIPRYDWVANIGVRYSTVHMTTICVRMVERKFDTNSLAFWTARNFLTMQTSLSLNIQSTLSQKYDEDENDEMTKITQHLRDASLKNHIPLFFGLHICQHNYEPNNTLQCAEKHFNQLQPFKMPQHLCHYKSRRLWELKIPVIIHILGIHVLKKRGLAKEQWSRTRCLKRN